MLNQSQLHEILDYDPSTGFLTWTQVRKGRAKKGNRAGSSGKNGRRTITVLGHHHWEHRVIWLHVHGELPKGEIDHINRDPSDNRIENLRVVSRFGNCQNTTVRSDCQSGIKGVYRQYKENYGARIRHKGKSHYLGYFKSKEEAHEAYKKAAKQLFGDHACDGMPSVKINLS